MANAAGSGLACETGNGLRNARSPNAGRPLCRGSRLIDVSAIVARLFRPTPGIGGRPGDRPARSVSGRGQMGARPGQGKRRAVFGSRLRGLEGPGDRKAHAGRIRRAPDGVSAVNNRISRLQIVRDRRDMISEYDAEAVLRRSAEAKKRLGATLRQCSELNRSFWWCKAIGGNLLDLPGIRDQEIPGAQSRTELRRRDGDGLKRTHGNNAAEPVLRREGGEWLKQALRAWNGVVRKKGHCATASRTG